MRFYFCWRCNRDMPFLNETEWLEVEPLLSGAIAVIKQYRESHHCDLATAKRECTPDVTRKFEQLTGVAGVNYETIYHHRLQDWGPECTQCGELLRTQKASYCAHCGKALA